jgi:hypothetical protein
MMRRGGMDFLVDGGEAALVAFRKALPHLIGSLH